MKIERIRNTQELINKVTNERCLVTSAVAGKSGIAIPYDNEGNLKETETFEINEDNAICFRIIKEADKTVPTGYSLNDGKLEGPDGLIETGSLKLKKILGAINGALIIVDEKGKLINYNPERDIFKHIERSYENIEVIEATDNYLLAIYSDTKEVKVADENEDKVITQTKFIASGLVLITDNQMCEISEIDLGLPFDLSSLNVTKIDKREYEDFSSHYLIFSTNLITNEDRTISESEETTYITFVVNNSSESTYISEIDVDSTKDKLVKAEYSKYYDQLVYFMENSIIIGDWIFEVPSDEFLTSECTYLIDKTRDAQSGIRSITFASADYRTKTVKSVKTKDRGFIYSVE